MEDKVERISWRKVRRQMWFEERKRDLIELKDKAVDGAKWAWDHKLEIGAGIASAVTVVSEGRRIYDRVHNRCEQYKSDREIYDPSLHKTLKLKRKMSNAQKRELQARFDEGEKIHDIIVDMGILK